MRYAKIDKCEYRNGIGCGVSLYVSGCPIRCDGCFNSEAWDFNYGELWNRRLTIQFLDAINKDYITRVSFLGGEPLADENVIGINKLIGEIKLRYPDKKIWLYTGYTIEEIFNNSMGSGINEYAARKSAVLSVNTVVDGRFEIDKRDLSLPFRGSSNQRILYHEKIFNIWRECNAKR